MFQGPVFQFRVFGGLPVDAVPIVMPLAAWHWAANSDVFTDQPRKM